MTQKEYPNLNENLVRPYDDLLVHMYKDTPIFVDFLKVNDANQGFFESMKDSLQIKKCIFT